MRLAVPNKGRLHDPAVALLERAGLHIRNGTDRKLYADTVDPEVSVLFARAADIPEYVADGAAAAGVTGLDQVRESQVDLADLLDLGFGECRLVLAAPEDGPIESVADLDGGDSSDTTDGSEDSDSSDGSDFTVATEFPNIASAYFDEKSVSPEVVEVSGATELTPHVDIADAIVDITSTGTTLRMNRLAVIDEVLESSVHLFAHPDRAEDPKLRQVATALESVLAADGKRYLMMNVPEDRLGAVEGVIPGMGGPTVMDIDGQEAVAVHAVVDEREVFEVINRLKDAGASDILVTEIERLVA